MKKLCVTLTICLALPGLVMAQSATETEVTEAIESWFAYASKNLKTRAEDTSKDGSLEFWSSGGLLQEVSRSDERLKNEIFKIKPVHIRVLPLVEGKSAVAQFYAQGAIKPEGFPAVTNYMTRVTQVFVKEGGKWKTRATHWSALQGGGGTTQTTQE